MVTIITPLRNSRPCSNCNSQPCSIAHRAIQMPKMPPIIRFAMSCPLETCLVDRNARIRAYPNAQASHRKTPNSSPGRFWQSRRAGPAGAAGIKTTFP